MSLERLEGEFTGGNETAKTKVVSLEIGVNICRTARGNSGRGSGRFISEVRSLLGSGDNTEFRINNEENRVGRAFDSFEEPVQITIDESFVLNTTEIDTRGVDEVAASGEDPQTTSRGCVVVLEAFPRARSHSVGRCTDGGGLGIVPRIGIDGREGSFFGHGTSRFSISEGSTGEAATTDGPSVGSDDFPPSSASVFRSSSTSGEKLHPVTVVEDNFGAEEGEVGVREGGKHGRAIEGSPVGSGGGEVGGEGTEHGGDVTSGSGIEGKDVEVGR